MASLRLKKLRADKWRKQGGRCHYCKSRMLLSQATADHKIPRSLGGKTTWNNITVACLECNMRKAAIPYEEFRARA